MICNRDNKHPRPFHIGVPPVLNMHSLMLFYSRFHRVKLVILSDASPQYLTAEMTVGNFIQRVVGSNSKYTKYLMNQPRSPQYAINSNHNG